MTGGAPPRVLVVEDSQAMREILREHLAEAGYEVATADNAVAATQLLRERRPDVMIVDANTREMNPYEFVATLSRDPHIPFFPILFLTFSQHAQESAALAGAAACVRMPVSAEQLLAVVAAHLKRDGAACGAPIL